MLRKLLALWARPRVLPEDIAVRLQGKPVCYVVESYGVADASAVQKACELSSLPLHCRECGIDGFPLIYLQRRRGFFGTRIDSRIPATFRATLRAAQAHPECDLHLIPVSVFWGRTPDRNDSWLQLWLAESWAIVGRFRRFMSVLVNGRNLLVQFGTPISVRASFDDRDHARNERRIARTLRHELRHQRIATIGPDLSHRRTIVTGVLRTRAVRQAMAAERKAKKISRHDAMQLAKRYTDEIAANYSPAVVSLLARLLRRIWNRLYDGVEVHHIEQLQAIVDGNEVIYVPCHRSHMDYLLLSHSIYMRGYVVPHIAAGLNLNMPVIGSILRRGGAFFLRRSFAGNTLYTMVFMRYLGLMVARGHSLEYFIEGGRSRTGRLLQPKTGMLSMTVRSYLRDPRRPVVFLPVYFGYERLVEGRTYISELSGQPKEKESILGILKVIPALRERYGKVNVSFGEPIKLNELLQQHAPQWRETSYEIEDRPNWLGRAIDDLATRIQTNVNAAACVTPVNLLSLVLLATPKQAMVEADLARHLELFASLLRQSPYSAYVVISDLDGDAMIRYGESMKLLKRHRHPLGDIISMSEENSVLLTYFRNNVLHLITLPSVIACCFLNNRSMRTEDIQRLAWRIYPYLRDELFLRWNEAELPAVVNGVLQQLARQGLLEDVGQGTEWQRPRTGSIEAVQLATLGNVTMQMIERYYLTISLILKAGSGCISQDALEKQCQLTAQRMSFLYELNSPEFFDKALFKNFIDLLRARNVLGVNSDGKLTYTDLLLAVSGDAQLVLHEQIRNSVLQVTHI